MSGKVNPASVVSRNLSTRTPSSRIQQLKICAPAVAAVKRAGPPLQPEHYCVRAFRNRALNYRRGLWRRVLRELESVRWFDRAESETPFEHAATRCLAELPGEQREVIVLKIWHEYTFETIGELLEISPNTAAGRYRYGLNKIKSCLKNYEELEPVGKSVALLAAAPTCAEN